MKDKLKKLWERLKGFWNGLTKVVKIVVIAAAALVIIGAIVLTVVLNSSDDDKFIVLFPNMSTEESAQVYQELQAQNVETKLDSDGQIMVRKSEWDTLVYNLAEKGYPQSAPSYGTFFDNLSMTMTEFEKQQTLRFELQDRLQTTLKRIDGIKGAIVTITFPDDDDYAWKKDDEDIAKASVQLTLSNSAGFTPANVSAVKNLVAFSAQKIEPSNVTVVDQTGKELMSAEEVELQNDGSGLDVKERMEYVSTLESRYEDKARRALANRYPDGVDAVASVTIDYDKVVQEQKQLNGNDEGNGFVTDEHREYDTNQAPVDEGGVTGEENNTDIPNYQNDREDELNSNNTPHYEDDVKIDWGYLLTQTERAQGTVSDASIAVVVATENEYMSRDERNDIVNLVRNATNINEDKISVSFRVVVPDEATGGQGDNWLQKNKTWLILAGIGLLLLLIGAAVIVILVLRRAKLRRIAEQEAHELEVEHLQEQIEEARKKTIEEQADEVNKKERQTEEEVREFAKNNPELTAALIRSMLKERDD